MTTNVNLSTRVLNLLKTTKTTPSRFRQLLLTKKSARTVSSITGVSTRTVQEYRKTIRDNLIYTLNV